MPTHIFMSPFTYLSSDVLLTRHCVVDAWPVLTAVSFQPHSDSSVKIKPMSPQEALCHLFQVIKVNLQGCCFQIDTSLVPFQSVQNYVQEWEPAWRPASVNGLAETFKSNRNNSSSILFKHNVKVHQQNSTYELAYVY